MSEEHTVDSHNPGILRYEIPCQECVSLRARVERMEKALRQVKAAMEIDYTDGRCDHSWGGPCGCFRDEMPDIDAILSPEKAKSEDVPDNGRGDAGWKFRKKPVVIEAERVNTIISLAGNDWVRLPAWVKKAYEQGNIIIRSGGLDVITLEGVMKANLEDMLILGVKGEIYPCKPDIFAMTYEPTPTKSSEEK